MVYADDCPLIGALRCHQPRALGVQSENSTGRVRSSAGDCASFPCYIGRLVSLGDMIGFVNIFGSGGGLISRRFSFVKRSPRFAERIGGDFNFYSFATGLGARGSRLGPPEPMRYLRGFRSRSINSSAASLSLPEADFPKVTTST